MALSDGDKAIVLALEVLRDRVTQLPLAIAQNAAQAAADIAAPTRPRAPAPDRPGATQLGVQALVGAFARLLGPLAALGTLLSAGTSGFSVFSKAIALFATAVAPVLLPVMFLLATALAAASEVIFRELLPALEGFFRYVLQTGIPAVIQFVETIGRATRAIMWLADSQVGKIALDAGLGGGQLGAINRTIDRLSGDNPDAGKSAVEKVRRGADDLTRSVPLIGGPIVDLSNWLKRTTGADADAGRRPEDGGAKAGSTEAVGRARADVLREMMLSMGPKASSGSVSSVWSRAQMASLNQSPFERRMLEMMMAVVNLLSRAEVPATGSFTEGVGGWISGAARALAAGRP